MWLYNTTGVEKSYQSIPIAATSFFQVQDSMRGKYQNDAVLLADILDGVIQVSHDGSTLITDAVLGLNALKNITPVDSDNVPLARSRAFATSDGFRFRGKGKQFTATKNTTTSLDYKLTEARHINGVQLLIKDAVFGDTIDFQIVDVDNILGYGAGVVLDTFGETWNVDPDMTSQGVIKVEYPAKIIANLYIRIIYTSVGTISDVLVHPNFFLHKEP